MAIQWGQIEGNAKFQGATPEKQQEIKQTFFDMNVAPAATKRGLDVGTVRSSFFSKTASNLGKPTGAFSAAKNEFEGLEAVGAPSAITNTLSLGAPKPKEVSEIPNGEAIAKQQTAWLGTVATPEKLAELRAKGGIGAMEAAERLNKWKMLPYLNAVSVADDVAIFATMKKSQRGEALSTEENADLHEFINDMIEVEARGYTIAGGITNAALQMPAYAVEFMVAFGSGGAAAPITGAKVAAKVATEKGLKAGIKGFLKTAAKTVAKTPIYMPHRVVGAAVDRRINDSIAITDKGAVIFKDNKESPAVTAFKALGDVVIENFSEQLGATIVRPIIKTAGKAVSRVLPKVLTEGFKTLVEKTTSLPFREAFAKFGYDGILEELGEERLGDLMRVSFDLDAEEGFSTDQFLGAVFPDKDDFLVELGAIAVFGGVSRATFELTNLLKKKGMSKKQAEQVVGSLSELQREKKLQDGLALEETPTEDQVRAAQFNEEFETVKRQALEDGKSVKQATLEATESVEASKAAMIAAQQGKNFLPVPKKSETLAQFIKKAGGIEVTTGEARRLTRKENPALQGVANKNGTLTLDAARALALSEGFIVDTAGAEQTTQSDIKDFMEAIEGNATRLADADAVVSREAIVEFNLRQAEINEQIVATTKEVRTLKQAFKLGAVSARKDVATIQQTVIKALETSGLSAADRAKFIRQIRKLQTHTQLAKAAPRIENRIEALLTADAKRLAREQIKKTISSAKKSKKTAIDAVESIRDLEAKLKDTGVLGKGIKETPIEAFQEALEQLGNLLTTGKLKLAILKRQKAERQNDRLIALAEGSVKLEETPLKTAPLGEVLGISDKIRNMYISGTNSLQRLNLNKNPMDVIFDIMDGVAGYQGATSTVFKKNADRSYSAYQQLKERTTRSVKNLADELKLKEGNFNRIGAWAALQQEGGFEKLLNTGVTKKELESLKLSEAEMRMFTAMRETLDSLRPAIKDTMRVAYNKDFGKVKDYFPFMTDFKRMNALEVQQMFGDDVFLISDKDSDFNRKDVKKGFTKARTGGRQAVRIDALSVFLSHVDNASYLIEMGQTVKELGELASSNEYNSIAGDVGQGVVVDWINLLARKGNISGTNAFLDTVRVNAGAAVLAFKLSSVVVQPTALLDGAAIIGGSYVTQGVSNVTNTEWRKFLQKNIPEIRERVGDDPSYLDMGGSGFWAKQQRAGFWALQKIDVLAASAIASGAYVKSVESRGGEVDLTIPDPIAVQDAQFAVRRTQSSAFAKDLPPIISQGKLTGNVSTDRMILQFQSFMLNRWSLIQHDFWNAGVKKGNTSQAINIATWLVLANIAEVSVRRVSREMISLLTGGDLGDEERDEPLWETTLMQALSNVPFVSSLVSSAEYGSIPVPSISLAASAFRDLGRVTRTDSDSATFDKNVALMLLGFAGATTGLSGTVQAQQLIRKGTKPEKKKGQSKKLSL